ncbi:MAG: substrate-binding periplasmic protein [Magnetovibrionaceae bacterium]
MSVIRSIGFCLLVGGGLWLSAMPVQAADLKIAITATTQRFSFVDEAGDRRGFNVAFIRAICDRMGRSCELETQRFPQVIPLVAAGEADIGVANTLKTPERAEKVAFSVPYWRSTSSFVGLKGQPERATDGSRLPVCVVEATRQKAFVEAYRAEDLTPLVVDSMKDLLANLKAGSCPLALLPTLQILSFLQSEGGRPFDYVGRPLRDRGLGGDVHMVVRPDDPDLLSAVNEAIRSLIEDGTHEKLTRLYFPFGIL